MLTYFSARCYGSTRSGMLTPPSSCRSSRPPGRGRAPRSTPAIILAPTSLHMKQHRSRHSDAGACPPGAAPENTLYFARVPPTLPCEEILALFETCGPVRHLQLYRPWCNARSSKVGAGAAAEADAWEGTHHPQAGPGQSACYHCAWVATAPTLLQFVPARHFAHLCNCTCPNASL